MDDNGISDSGLFLPAEAAASKLMADELSWKRKHDLPVAQNFTSFQESKELQYMSIGEFFQQGSDNISEFRATSPYKEEPIPLIDATIASNVNDYIGDSDYQSRRSLSIRAIQKFLVEAEDTPTKITDNLFKHGTKTSSRKFSTQRQSNDVFSLPVSRDTSYTTSFSDNEAVRGKSHIAYITIKLIVTLFY